MAKKKVKRYDDGGEVEGGLREVSKSRFDDDTNARARSFVDSGYRAEAMPVDDEPAPKARSLITPKPKPASSQETIGPQGMREAPDTSSQETIGPQGMREAPAKKLYSPSQIRNDRNGPIGDAVDAAKKYYDKGSPNMPVVKRIKKENSDTTLFKRKPKESAMAKGGKVSSASSRADGIAQRGKTRGKYC
jgi:hypothetical protein